MKLACQEHLIPGATLIEKWEFIASVGFDGIELHGHGEFKFRERLPELRAAQRAGVIMPSVCVIMDHFIGDFDAEKRRDAIDNMKSLLSVIAEIGGQGAITPAAFGLFSRALPPFKPPRSPEEDREVLLEGLRELGEHATGEGIFVLLEPLNRYEDHMLHTLQEASDLCAAVGLASLKVMGDFFHMSIEEQDLAVAIAQAGQDVTHMHLADSNRQQPGMGHTDFKPALAALKRIGFGGYMALECGIRGERKAALAETSRYIRSLLSDIAA
ncbi:MAG: sugar phosphate isomerase/epimerase family protein [Roseiflexaceae bacterium]